MGIQVDIIFTFIAHWLISMLNTDLKIAIIFSSSRKYSTGASSVSEALILWNCDLVDYNHIFRVVKLVMQILLNLEITDWLGCNSSLGTITVLGPDTSVSAFAARLDISINILGLCLQKQRGSSASSVFQSLDSFCMLTGTALFKKSNKILQTPKLKPPECRLGWRRSDFLLLGGTAQE